MEISVLQKVRASYEPKLPPAFANGALVTVAKSDPTESISDQESIQKLFPVNYGKPILEFSVGSQKKAAKPINVGVILSGGQAPGGHNVIAGIFDGLKSINEKCKLYGFIGGPSGLVENKYIEITAELLSSYRNTGGFDIIGSGRTKLETAEQFEKSAKNCKKLGISALIVIGGDDSNTNACLLAEHYCMKRTPIQVIGCPKTIDGDLKNLFIETSFGFDTACKVYSELIGNISRDADSARKYWHFIRLMGRSASHITLECALQTRPNIAIISEEVAKKKQTLADIVDDMVKVICKRAKKGRNFGVVLIPEGLIEFIPEIKKLINELNEIMTKDESALNFLKTDEDKTSFIKGKLSNESASVYVSMPLQIQIQLIKDRDPHGNVQVSMIETEKLLIQMIESRMSLMKSQGKSEVKDVRFKAQTHFLGYEGRCAAPSNFDADYCYSLGATAAALVGCGSTGYMAAVRNLTKPSDQWLSGGIPITMMMNMERRHGKEKPVIQKSLVDLHDKPFETFAENRDEWAVETEYLYPGPIQYFGPSEVCDQTTKTLALERS
ncbi:MAG TPA: diphosphate--fructose-6-phosphate 1-phosphotransferase [Lentisphaeria bacterium]|nr:MAG: diphosphate--fructose-6-phosphate 1-phosphotransferase [Lentisphaerae bacterium GWF2_50_93]HCE43721.1 diphosphate--fructose-6-phosphate 1-phosphotransferase [Lentisphaeria bacterium]